MEIGTRAIDEHLRRFDGRGPEPLAGDRWTVHFDGTSASEDSFAHSVARGLSDHPRWLDWRYLYDGPVSRIFAAHHRAARVLPDRRRERDPGRERATRSASCGPGAVVELGAARREDPPSARRVAARRRPSSTTCPIDIAPSVAEHARQGAGRRLPAADRPGVATSYERGLDAVARRSPMCSSSSDRTIGQPQPDEPSFLARSRAAGARRSLLLGIDLAKDGATLEAAYDDAARVEPALHAQPVRADEQGARHGLRRGIHRPRRVLERPEGADRDLRPVPAREASSTCTHRPLVSRRRAARWS